MGHSVYHAPNTVDGVYLIPVLEDDYDADFYWYDIVDEIASAMRFPNNNWQYWPFVDEPRSVTNEHLIIARIPKHEMYITLSEYIGVFALSVVYYGERPLSKRRAAYVKAQVNRFKKHLKCYYKGGTFSNGEAVFYPYTTNSKSKS